MNLKKVKQAKKKFTKNLLSFAMKGKKEEQKFSNITTAQMKKSNVMQTQ